MEEIWKDVIGYEGLYQISSIGNIKGLERLVKGLRNTDVLLSEKSKATRIHKKGYVYTDLCKNGEVKTKSIHRLVATAFIPNPENKRCVNHKDGNKQNNASDNLEWNTHKENRNHATETGLWKPRFIVVHQFDLDNNHIREWSSAEEVEQILGIYSANIAKSCKYPYGKFKTGNYYWSYSKEVSLDYVKPKKNKDKYIIVTDLDSGEEIEYFTIKKVAEVLNIRQNYIGMILNGQVKKTNKLGNKTIRFK